jgi:hypothetical protein
MIRVLHLSQKNHTRQGESMIVSSGVTKALHPAGPKGKLGYLPMGSIKFFPAHNESPAHSEQPGNYR